MKYLSNKIKFDRNAEKAFSLIEAVTALAILALICTSVLAVINRSMSSVANMTLRMQAFETVRENMEQVLLADTTALKIEYGTSEQYPEIEWQTSIEAFHEPVTDRMWIQAVCSAQYFDTEGEEQKVELTHWLTGLTKKQLKKLIEQGLKDKEKWLAEKMVETIEEAAEYADVDEETVEQWIDNGMPLTDDGRIFKDWLDLYKEHDGDPSEEDKKKLRDKIDGYILGGG